jgi:hypothetical protein
MSEDPQSFAAFWPHYLAAHADPRTRALHYAGTGCALILVAGSLVIAKYWLLLAAVVLGYGPAWAGHVLFEGNRPATFTHPWWSLIGDFRMFFLAATGRLRRELARVAGR